MEIPYLEIPVKPVTYRSGVYGMHRYWGKKPYNIIDYFIEKYSSPGDIVFDPFCGSGVIPLEAYRLGRRGIGIDINPVAVFIARNTVEYVSLDRLRYWYKYIEKTTRTKIEDLYRTICSCCGGEAIGTHYIWRGDSIIKVWFKCRVCGCRGKKKPDYRDLELVDTINKQAIPYWYPRERLVVNPRINVVKETHVDQLFTYRNLYALSILYKTINDINDKRVREFFRFIFTSMLPQVSKMVFVIRRRGRATGDIRETEAVGSWVTGYWVPKEYFEVNVWHAFRVKFKKLYKYKALANKYFGKIHTNNDIHRVLAGIDKLYVGQGDACTLEYIPSSSIDLVFTDPPHLDSVPYLELSILWASWLRYRLDFDKEIVVSNSPERRKDYDSYFTMLHKAIKEIYRVLKPNKYLIIIFNTSDIIYWSKIIELFNNVGFRFEAIASYTSSHPSIKQLTRKRSLRGDIYVVFKKARSKTCTEHSRVAIDKVIEDIRNYLGYIIKHNESIETAIAKTIAYTMHKYGIVPPRLNTVFKELLETHT